MAGVRGPLFGLDASGTIADTITFSKWKGRPYVRQKVNPANPNTAAQRAVRSVFQFTSQQYDALSAVIKAKWLTEAGPDNITALNAFARSAQDQRLIDKGPLQDPTLTPGAAPAAPTAPVATGQKAQAQLTWVDSVAADKYTHIIYGSATIGFTAGPTNILAVVANGILTRIITDLPVGLFYFRIKCGSTSGTLSVATAEFSTTIT